MHGIKSDCQCIGEIRKNLKLGVTAEFTTGTPTFQNNNYRVHRVTSVCDLLAERDGTLRHFDQPAKSPDLSFIEKVWDYLEQQTKLRNRYKHEL